MADHMYSGMKVRAEDDDEANLAGLLDIKVPIIIEGSATQS
jgi:hypothetical protein